jgi:hypothetical protein
MRKPPGWSIIIFCSLLLLGFEITCRIISKTPKGIDPNPLFDLQLPSDTNLFILLSKNDSALARKYNCRLIHQLELGMNAHGQYNDWIDIPSTNDTIKNIFRGIEIWQFATSKGAVERYMDYRKIFKEDASARIYEEKSQLDKKYFMIYKTVRFDYNHGIPYKIYNDPELMLGFLINKYCVFISYTKYTFGQKTPEYYKSDINNDIIYVSTFFKDVILHSGDKE